MKQQQDIEIVVNNFKSTLNHDDRYTSFDYCYNYFRKTDDLTKDIEKSCLELGFYLASWGMLRGSSFLLQKSIVHLQPTIEYINELDKSIWSIDVDKYSEDNILLIIKIYNEIKSLLIPKGKSDLTLLTKVLLGVFGFIPAYDKYFCETFRQLSNGKCGFRKVNTTSLNLIKQFYENNKILIDNLADMTFTTDFISGNKTEIKYTKAKIIDMYGFNKMIINK